LRWEVSVTRRLVAFLVTVLFVGPILAQTPDTPPPGSDTANHEWSFSLATSGYIIPDDQSYASPTFSADHKWLHLEARYNYENLETASLWAGYNFSFGDRLVLDVTPMVGAVFGNINGIAPGFNFALSYKRIELSSQGEFVIDPGDSTRNFFYSWNELSYSLTDWLRAGLASQRTRVYQTPLDVQRGFLVGFNYKKVDFTTYVFNAGWTDPTVVLSLGIKF